MISGWNVFRDNQGTVIGYIYIYILRAIPKSYLAVK